MHNLSDFFNVKNKSSSTTLNSMHINQKIIFSQHISLSDYCRLAAWCINCTIDNLKWALIFLSSLMHASIVLATYNLKVTRLTESYIYYISALVLRIDFKNSWTDLVSFFSRLIFVLLRSQVSCRS